VERVRFLALVHLLRILLLLSLLSQERWKVFYFLGLVVKLASASVIDEFGEVRSFPDESLISGSERNEVELTTSLEDRSSRL
jgi:hypothetical protein